MNLYDFFSPVWIKTCPHCGETIHIGKLKKIEQNKQLKWYQFTPPPHAACPNCGGFVVSTGSNSPRIALFFAVPLIIAFAGILFPKFRPLIEMSLGYIFFLLPIWIFFLLLATKYEYLIPEEDE